MWLRRNQIHIPSMFFFEPRRDNSRLLSDVRLLCHTASDIRNLEVVMMKLLQLSKTPMGFGLLFPIPLCQVLDGRIVAHRITGQAGYL
mgnify:CR=1 FL=1